MRVRIVFHNWKDESIHYTVEGTIVPYSENPVSDRIVLLDESGQYIDIIKNTIISTTQLTEGQPDDEDKS